MLYVEGHVYYNCPNLFHSYLSNRKQCANINRVLSDLICIELGVPQGSVLGPLLFLLYINDLPLVTNSVSKLYAEDTCLLILAPTLSELQIAVNREMNKLYRWMCSNKLSLNS